jgi:asparagine synthase (glutamine-hydrolysing)
MCAIAGILRFREGEGAWLETLRRMMHSERHRGPDAEGVYLDECIALGHRRLSIIDLSEAANQPMTDSSGRYIISFNGEIYNFREIKAQLKDYPFKTHSDTEVILAAFGAWGQGCLARLKGQFAFALWDRIEKRLFMARDRLGEKPFYYHLGHDRLIFASELRALLESGLVPRRISRAGLLDYLVMESVRSPRTLVEDVYQLPAGHFAWVSQSGEFRMQRYWNILTPSFKAVPQTYAEACRGVRERLIRAIEGQMVSDVPLGVFLSGGIDSSAITGLMARHSDEPITTFTIAFDERDFDESCYAQEVARRFNTLHHVVHLKPATLMDELPNYFASVDAPSGDGPNMYVVAKAAKEAGLTVALSGIGGDELFCGYKYFKWYWTYVKCSAFFRLPVKGRKLLASLGTVMRREGSNRKMQRILLMGERDAEGFYELVRSAYLLEEALAMLSARWLPPEANLPNLVYFSDLDRATFSSLPILSQYSALEFTNYTANVLLKDADSLAMASAVEVRVPFCDHELVEYVLSVPDRFKYPVTPKRLLIDALDGLLPESIVNRPKMGFAFPWESWIKGELRGFCEDAIRSVGERGLFDPAKVDGMWRSFLAQEGGGGWSRIWLLVALEQWLRKTGVA